MSLGFLHIPKTGGRTCAAYFDQWFPGQVRAVPTHEDALVQARTGWRRDDRWLVAHGHQALPFWSGLGIGSVFTVLRDPVERVVSAFRYVWRNDIHVLHGQFVAEKLTIGDFVRHPRLSFHAVNMQTRMLGLECDIWDVLERRDRGCTSPERARQLYAELVGGACDERTLARAITALESRVCFTTTDRLDTAMLHLGNRLGVEVATKGIRKNASPGSPGEYQLSESDRATILDHNALDAHLFAAGSRILGKDLLGGDIDIETPLR